MDNKFEITQDDYQPQKSMYIACSLGAKQSVQCTFISNEPMFYIDEENIDDADDLLLDDETYELIKNELTSLTCDLSDMDGVIEREIKKEDLILEFMADAMIISDTPFNLNKDEIKERLVNMLSKSRMAGELLNFAVGKGVEIKITDQVESVLYDAAAKVIFVRDDFDFNTQVLMTAEALRQVWQNEKGAIKHPLSFHPDHAVLASRAQQADLKTILIRTAWELKLAGETQFWSMLYGSPLSDLARAYAREANKDFRSLDNGKAAASVFEAWFLSERCNHQDKKLIQSMLAENNNFIFDSVETSYRRLTKMLMALGSQPYGKNYLARFTELIMNDPLFTDVRDRSNANFLWFVKFERAYDEVEQGLHSADVTTLPGIERAQKTQKDTHHDTAQQSESNAADKPAFRENILKPDATHGDNIIIVDFGGYSFSREERL